MIKKKIHIENAVRKLRFNNDERDKIYELYALQLSSVIFGISIVTTLVLLGWFNLSINTGLIVITFAGFIGSILSLFLKIYLYRY